DDLHRARTPRTRRRSPPLVRRHARSARARRVLALRHAVPRRAASRLATRRRVRPRGDSRARRPRRRPRRGRVMRASFRDGVKRALLRRRRVAFPLTVLAAAALSTAAYTLAISQGSSPQAATLLRLVVSAPVIFLGLRAFHDPLRIGFAVAASTGAK